MKELKTITEYQLLSMAYEILLRNIEHEEEINDVYQRKHYKH